MKKLRYIPHWDSRKEKKARFKRKIARLKKRGNIIFGGYVNFTDELDIK